jgi:hypothetical protein
MNIYEKKYLKYKKKYLILKQFGGSEQAQPTASSEMVNQPVTQPAMGHPQGMIPPPVRGYSQGMTPFPGMAQHPAMGQPHYNLTYQQLYQNNNAFYQKGFEVGIVQGRVQGFYSGKQECNKECEVSIVKGRKEGFQIGIADGYKKCEDGYKTKKVQELKKKESTDNISYLLKIINDLYLNIKDFKLISPEELNKIKDYSPVIHFTIISRLIDGEDKEHLLKQFETTGLFWFNNIYKLQIYIRHLRNMYNTGYENIHLPHICLLVRNILEKITLILLCTTAFKEFKDLSIKQKIIKKYYKKPLDGLLQLQPAAERVKLLSRGFPLFKEDYTFNLMIVEAEAEAEAARKPLIFKKSTFEADCNNIFGYVNGCIHDNVESLNEETLEEIIKLIGILLIGTYSIIDSEDLKKHIIYGKNHLIHILSTKLTPLTQLDIETIVESEEAEEARKPPE